MTHNLEKLCSDFLIKVQSESDSITNRIDTSYKEDNDKEKLFEKYEEQIDTFLEKYNYAFVGIVNKDTNEVLDIDKKCSDKLDEIVNKLKNYIADLK